MSDAIWAAVIGAVATVVAAAIAARGRHTSPSVPPPAGNDEAGATRLQRSPDPVPSSPPPAVAADGLSFDEVIAQFEAEGGVRGKTTLPRSAYYEAAKNLRFVRCLCGWNDAEYGYHEYIGRTPRGAVYYIGMRLGTKSITCGPKGYHYYRTHVPVCVRRTDSDLDQ